MRQILIAILIICSIQTIVSHLWFEEVDNFWINKRKLTQKIVQKQNSQVQKITHKQKYFQSYHFQLDFNKPSFQFFIDTQVNDQLKGHLKVLWKHKNTYVMPHVLKIEKVQLKIFQNQNKVDSKRFYTKVGFKINAKQDKLYKIKVYHNKDAKIAKLVTLNVQHFFESFEEHNQNEQEKYLKRKSEKLSKQNKELEQQDESKDSQSEESQNQLKQEAKIDQDKQETFELTHLQQRIQLLLNETKLLINQAQTKHLAQHTIQKQIQDSIQIYWTYEIAECAIVVLCVVVEILLINRLFNQNKLVQLI